MNITTTHHDNTITYTLHIDGTDASELTITADTRKVENIETREQFQRQGLARTLWEHANLDGEIFHALEHHRTPEGDAFAEAMGGETIDEELDYNEYCSVCTGEYDDLAA